MKSLKKKLLVAIVVMSEVLGHIEDYFTGRLSAAEKQAFEDKCESDPAFANEVAFYISARDRLNQELHNEKKKEFDELYIKLEAQPKPILRRIYPYVAAAAACLILFIGWRLFFTPPSMQNLAGNYIENNLKSLGTSMGGQQDTLQQGIAAYNNGNYSEAERIFTFLSVADPANPEPVQYLGQVYLLTDRYNEAIVQFDKLSKITGMYSNPGAFYKAIALMKRAQKGDREQARQLLQQIANERSAGYEEAEAWLKKI